MSDEITSYRAAQIQAVNTMLKEEEKSLKLLATDDEWNKELTTPTHQPQTIIPEGSVGIYSPVTGRIWEIAVSKGELVKERQVVASVEAMKMECSCYCPVSGTVSRILVIGRQLVHQGDLIMIIKVMESREDCLDC